MEEYKMVVNRSGRQVSLSLKRGIRIRLEYGNQRYIFEDISGPNKIVRLGPWLVEKAQNAIGFRNVNNGHNIGYPDEGELQLYFQNKQKEETAEITLLFMEQDDPSRKQKRLTRKVKRVVLARESFRLLMPDDREQDNVQGPISGPIGVQEPISGPIVVQEPISGPIGGQEPISGPIGGQGPTPGPIRGPEPTPSELEAYLEREKGLLERINELEEENKKLRAENKAIRANSTLADQLSAESGELERITQETENTEKQLKDVRRKLTQKGEELSRKKEELSQKKEELLKSAEENERVLTDLNKELAQLQERSEYSQIDIEHANKELRGMRERLADDTLTIAAIEDDAMIIGGGSVKDSLGKAEAELEKVEKKISRIIKVRELVNDRVQEAVVRKGTGFLTAGGETGGE